MDRNEIILKFMLSLVQNDALCLGADDDIEWVLNYAKRLTDVYLKKIK